MVLDRLVRAPRHAGLSPMLARALRHLTVTDWILDCLGRHAVDSDDLVAIVSEYDTQVADSFAILWPDEAHRPRVAVHGPVRVKKVVLRVSAAEGSAAGHSV